MNNRAISHQWFRHNYVLLATNVEHGITNIFYAQLFMIHLNTVLVLMSFSFPWAQSLLTTHARASNLILIVLEYTVCSTNYREQIDITSPSHCFVTCTEIWSIIYYVHSWLCVMFHLCHEMRLNKCCSSLTWTINGSVEYDHNLIKHTKP